MRVQVRNCTECRQKIHKEEQEAYLKKQYAWLNDGMYTMACLATTAAIAVQMQRGRSKDYIQKFFSDMVMIYTTSSVMGKPIDMVETMKMLEKEYGIDFSRIHVNFNESEKEFIKNCKKIR
jgi:hypothetical protein